MKIVYLDEGFFYLFFLVVEKPSTIHNFFIFFCNTVFHFFNACFFCCWENEEKKTFFVLTKFRKWIESDCSWIWMSDKYSSKHESWPQPFTGNIFKEDFFVPILPTFSHFRNHIFPPREKCKRKSLLFCDQKYPLCAIFVSHSLMNAAVYFSFLLFSFLLFLWYFYYGMYR